MTVGCLARSIGRRGRNVLRAAGRTDGGDDLDIKRVAGLDPEELRIIEAVATWVDREVKPCVRELEHDDSYPEQLIEQMKELGVFGLLVPAAFGGVDVSVRCFAAVTEELARGWMSLAGAMGGHSVVVNELRRYGTVEQQETYLPRLATGELRATMALTEPGGGSDLQAMRTVARREGDELVLDGSKTWITNAERSGLCAVLCKTDPDAEPAHRGMSVVLVEKDPGFTVGRALPKLGYKGIESCELFFDDCRVPVAAILGGEPGQGFAQMMSGLEIGRIQVAARATGVARAAFDDALAYAQQRRSFGVPIWRHQSVGNHLATMGTKITAARAACATGRHHLRPHWHSQPRGRHGEALRVGSVRRGGTHRVARARWYGVLDRARHRAVLPRRTADDRRRRHQRDPTRRDRARARGARRAPMSVALVTGAAGAIGTAIHDALSAAGWTVAAADLKDTPYTVDIADEVDVDRVVDAVVRDHGRLDAVVNNAGIAADAPLHKMSLATFRAVVQVNLEGTFLVTRAALRHMRARDGGGRIVNISSMSARLGNFGQANYAASKAGVIALDACHSP